MPEKSTFAGVPHQAYVMVGDGQKAIFLRNEGTGISPRLKTEQVLTIENPPTHAQGTDGPGRAFSSVDARRSAMEQTDWHELAEQRFARTIAGALEELARAESFPGVVIAAPARTMAELRRALGDGFRRHVIAEIQKDLTRHPVQDIEKHLAMK